MSMTSANPMAKTSNPIATSPVPRPPSRPRLRLRFRPGLLLRGARRPRRELPDGPLGDDLGIAGPQPGGHRFDPWPHLRREVAGLAEIVAEVVEFEVGQLRVLED